MTRNDVLALAERDLAAVQACNRTRDGCQGGGGVDHPHETRTLEREIAALRAIAERMPE